MNTSQIIVRPVLTEKSVAGTGIGKYTFVVHRDATKIDIKSAFKGLYGVTVTSVNILKGLPKSRFGKNRRLMEKKHLTRRAVITLKKGEKLDISKLTARAARRTAH